jgi:hypothetical protein
MQVRTYMDKQSELMSLLCSGVVSPLGCAHRGESLGCVEHPGNLRLLKGAVRTGWGWGVPSRRWFQDRGRILSPQIAPVIAFLVLRRLRFLRSKLEH